MIPRELYADLIGKPWARGCRGPGAFDCVGLLLEMQRRLGHVAADIPSSKGAFDLALAPRGEWAEVAAPEPGDALLIRSAHPRWHVAVVIGLGLMIHGKEGAGVVVERFDTPLYASRVKGVYRWRAREFGQSA